MSNQLESNLTAPSEILRLDAKNEQANTYSKELTILSAW